MAEVHHVQVENKPLHLVMVISSLTRAVASQMQPELKHKSETRMYRIEHDIQFEILCNRNVEGLHPRSRFNPTDALSHVTMYA
jgi:hypothetical protein